MKEFIEREAAIEALRSGFSYHSYAGESAAKIINAIPAADVRPVVRGKWIYTLTEPLGYICSECGKGCCNFSYCPNCGARMEES